MSTAIALRPPHGRPGPLFRGGIHADAGEVASRPRGSGQKMQQAVPRAHAVARPCELARLRRCLRRRLLRRFVARRRYPGIGDGGAAGARPGPLAADLDRESEPDCAANCWSSRAGWKRGLANCAPASPSCPPCASSCCGRCSSPGWRRRSPARGEADERFAAIDAPGGRPARPPSAGWMRSCTAPGVSCI